MISIQFEEDHIHEQKETELPINEEEEITKADKEKGCVCPVCNIKFESSVNKTRINNHLDKCLLEVSDILTQTHTTSSPEKRKDSNAQNEKAPKYLGKKAEGKKRLDHSISAEYQVKVKKSKKIQVETSSMKLENFFMKK